MKMYYKTKWHLFSTTKKLLESNGIKVTNTILDNELEYFSEVCFDADQLKKYSTSLCSQFYFEAKHSIEEGNEINIEEIFYRAAEECNERENKENKSEFDTFNSMAINRSGEKVIETLKSILAKPGIYYLYDEDKQLIYIGKSLNLGSRIIGSYYERKANYFRFSVIPNKSDVHILEPYLINRYKPALNREFLEKDIPSFEIPLPDISKEYNHIVWDY